MNDLTREERESAARDAAWRRGLHKVARMLCEADRGGVTVEALAKASGLSREAILERIDHLKAFNLETYKVIIEVSEGYYRSDIPLSHLFGDIKAARRQWWEDR